MSGPAQNLRKSNRGRAFARWMFYTHLWLSVPITGLVISLSVTGILLNHKRPLGLMPDPEVAAPAPVDQALPLHELIRRAEAAYPGPDVPPVDRMDVRPSRGLVKVRFDDRPVTEVSLDLSDGTVLEVGERHDVFLEKVHSGEVFGDPFVVITTIAGLALMALLGSGFWMWLYPKYRVVQRSHGQPRPSSSRKTSP